MCFLSPLVKACICDFLACSLNNPPVAFHGRCKTLQVMVFKPCHLQGLKTWSSFTVSNLPISYLHAELLPPCKSIFYLTGIAQIYNWSWNLIILFHSLLNAVTDCKLSSFDWNPSTNTFQKLLPVKQNVHPAYAFWHSRPKDEGQS